MKVCVAGASGIIGQAVVEALALSEAKIVRLVRRAPRDSSESQWSPAENLIDAGALGGCSAVVCLSGEPINGRWTADKRRRILDSRVQCVGLLSRTIQQMDNPPKVFVSASAVGYYGDSGQAPVDESAPRGGDFLARVCAAWESAVEPVKERGIRHVQLRFGVVLSGRGGALRQMLLPFRLGAGAVMGSGSQYMSWVSDEDAAKIVLHVLRDKSIRGPVNAVAPAPVTNREFSKTLARVLGRPCLFSIPSFAVGILFGEMGRTLLLSSQRAVPTVLRESGYEYRHATIKAALRQALAR